MDLQFKIDNFNYNIDRNGDDPIHLCFEIVFVDNSLPKPLLFQLHNDHRILTDNSSKNLNQIFEPIGEISLINFEKKIVVLENKQSISYTYLIEGTGIDHSHEFRNGLSLLFEALRLKQDLRKLLSENKQPSKGIRSATLNNPLLEKNLDLIFSSGSFSKQNGRIDFFGRRKKLFQVHF